MVTFEWKKEYVHIFYCMHKLSLEEYTKVAINICCLGVSEGQKWEEIFILCSFVFYECWTLKCPWIKKKKEIIYQWENIFLLSFSFVGSQ